MSRAEIDELSDQIQFLDMAGENRQVRTLYELESVNNDEGVKSLISKRAS